MQFLSVTCVNTIFFTKVIFIYRYVAVAEKGTEKASITIYDLHSLRKKKTLSSVDIQSQEISSLAFSPDSKYLIAQGGRPDWTLVYWTWEKSKVMAVTKTSNPANNDIHQVSIDYKKWLNDLFSNEYCKVLL